jgi:hypothetical protein
MSTLFSKNYKVGLIAVRSKDWNSSNPDSPEGGLQNHSPLDEDPHPSSISNSQGFELTVLSPSDEDGGETATGEEDDSKIRVQKSDTQLFFEKISRHNASEHLLHYGDVVLCVVDTTQLLTLQTSSDFFVVSTVGDLPKPLDLWNSLAVIIFLIMMILVATEFIDMCPAALTVTCIYFIGGWVTYKEIPKLIDIRLLMLMGCSLSFAKSMTKTGLALRIAQQISSSNPSAFEGILFIYAVTLVITELISNNAAAALMYPIAVALADELKVHSLPMTPSHLFLISSSLFPLSSHLLSLGKFHPFCHDSSSREHCWVHESNWIPNSCHGLGTRGIQIQRFYYLWIGSRCDLLDRRLCSDFTNLSFRQVSIAQERSNRSIE